MASELVHAQEFAHMNASTAGTTHVETHIHGFHNNSATWKYVGSN